MARQLAEQLNIRIYDSYLRYYYHIAEPEALDDDEWAERLQELHFIRTKEREASEQK